MPVALLLLKRHLCPESQNAHEGCSGNLRAISVLQVALHIGYVHFVEVIRWGKAGLFSPFAQIRSWQLQHRLRIPHGGGDNQFAELTDPSYRLFGDSVFYLRFIVILHMCTHMHCTIKMHM